MFVNLLVLLIVLALTVVSGWLTWKAVRALKLWLKIAGGLGAGLLTLLLAAITFFGAKGLAAFYFSGVGPAPDLTVEGSAEQIARGEYLADIGCVGCHGTYANGFEGDPTFPLAGGIDILAGEDFPPIGQIIPENLTPGGKLADYSDGELFRVIRHGVNQDGRLLAFMSLLPYGQMSDEDIMALIAFLRSQPAVTSSGPTGDKLNFLGVIFFGAGLFPAPEKQPDTIAAIPAGPTAEYGKYVATFGECRGCHGSDMTGVPASQFIPEVPNPRPLVGTLDAAQFIEMMRTGVRPGNIPFPESMPWQNAAKMNDDDLIALYTFLATEP